MEFEESQFTGATPSGEDFDSFATAIPPASAPVENGGDLDGFFGGSSGAPAAGAVPVATEALGMEYQASDASAANALDADPDAPAEGTTAPATDDDPFFQHYTPPSLPALAPEPETVDPRVDWRRQNNEQLKKKDVEESGAKQQVREAAAKHLARFYEVRTTTLTQRKTNNRKSEAHQKEVEVPASGTAWEKINALVNFNSGIHQKDVARYKAVLIACKAKNVAVQA